MRLHPKVPLIAFLDLVHLGIPLTAAVFGRTPCGNQGGVHHGAGLKQHAVGRQLGVDDLQNLGAQLVLFEQMSKTQYVGPVRSAVGAVVTDEVTIKTSLEQGFFGPQVRQTKPLLQAVDAQHERQIKRRASCLGHRCVRRNQRQQLAPRHDLLHFFEQDLLARAPATQFKAKIFLFLAAIVPRLMSDDYRVCGEF